jgi:GTP-binding protein HflX
LDKPSPQYYLGPGKLKELAALKGEKGYNVVISDDELLPRQQRNLEEALGVKVIDRTALILDIFAKRAQTREGQFQVELAQHQYLLPRLIGQWSHLERLGGGIGTRGPGESQLETDRRLIRRRIERLKAEIEAIRKHRTLYRQRRKKSSIPIVALVGYTNTGKSTLLNTLSSANVQVADKLFATLDPTTRHLTLPNKQEILLTDTVGFIHKLPPNLLAAFRATLEELAEADLLLHIVDITHADAAEQCQTVEGILSDLGLIQKPKLIALNKIDLLLEDEELEGAITHLTQQFNMEGQGIVSISAAKGWGLDKLMHLIAGILAANPRGFAALAPLS